MRIFSTIVAAQRGQGFLWAPVFMGLGIIAYFSLSFEPLWFVSLVALAGLGGALALVWRLGHLWRLWGMFALCVVAGFSLAQYRTWSVYTPILSKKIEPVEVFGTIALIENQERGVRLTLRDVEIERLKPELTPRRVRITFRKAQDVKIGQRVRVLAGLSPPSAPIVPDGFDFQRYMFFKGLGASGFSYGDAQLIEGGRTLGGGGQIERIRHGIEGRINMALPAEKSAMTAALMTGYRSAITDADYDAMRGAGLAHILAISGLHIGLFSGVVFFLVRLILSFFPSLALYYPIKKYAAVCAIIAAVFYMLLAGSTVPTQRATLMSGIVLFAIILDRWPFSLRLVSFAALCVLALAPESLLSASFHMSFGAVAALIAFYEWSAPWWRKFYGSAGVMRRIFVYVLGVCMTSVIATLATAPYALFHFQQLAVYSLLGNVLAMPVLSFVVMPGAVLSYILMLVGLEDLALVIVGYGVEGILDVAHFVSGLKGAALHVGAWPVEVLLLFCAAFVGLILLKGHVRFIVLVPFSMAVFLIVNAPTPFLLVSSGAKLISYREDGGALSFSALNKERFARNVWVRAFGREGEDSVKKWPREGAMKDSDAVFCGEEGCRISHHGVIVDVLSTANGFIESCIEADVIIVQQGVRATCAGKIVIDKWDTYRGGVHALYMDGAGLRVQRAEYLRGLRPWTIGYQRVQRYKND